MAKITSKPYPVCIWDVPTRVFHWLMVAAFITAYYTGNDDHLALVHSASGFTILGLLCFRLLWGLIGSRYARFSDFICGPKTILAYLRSLCNGDDRQYTGHNPAGGLAILLILLLGLIATISGALVYEEFDWPMLEEIHETSADLMLALVVIHVCGVLVSSFLHRENLVRAMVTGNKIRCKELAIEQRHRPIGLLIVAAAIIFWLWFTLSK